MTTVPTFLDAVSDGSQTFESASDGTSRKMVARTPSSDESCDFQDALTGYETSSHSDLKSFEEQDDRNLRQLLDSFKQSHTASDRTESLEAVQPDTVDGNTVQTATQVKLPKWEDLRPSLVTLDRDVMPSTKTTKSAKHLSARSDVNPANRNSSPFPKSEVDPNNDPHGEEWTGDDTTSDYDTHMSSLWERLHRGNTGNRRAQASFIPPSTTNRRAPAPTTETGGTKSVLSSFRDWAASTASGWRWRGDTRPARKTAKTAENTISNFSRPNRLSPTYSAATTTAATTRSTLTQTTYNYASSAYHHISNAVQSFYSSRVAPYIPAATHTLNSWAASVVSGVGDLARRAKDWAEQSQTISRARSHLGSTLWPRSVMSEAKNVTTESFSEAHGGHGELGPDAGSSRTTVPGAGSVTGRQTGGVRMRR